MKQVICRKESESKLRVAGPGVPAAEIPSAPNVTGMLLAAGACVAQELGAASREPGLPQDLRKRLLLGELENYGKKQFFWDSPALAIVWTLHPFWLAEHGYGMPQGHRCWPRRPPLLQWQAPSQNETISLADQSSVCPLLGFPCLESSQVGKKSMDRKQTTGEWFWGRAGCCWALSTAAAAAC